MKLLKEEEQRKLAEKKQRKYGINLFYWCYVYVSCRLEYWNRNGYSSLNVTVDSDSDEASSDSEGEEDEAWSGEISYVKGDVTHPQNAGNNDLIIVHCVGKMNVLSSVRISLNALLENISLDMMFNA